MKAFQGIPMSLTILDWREVYGCATGEWLDIGSNGRPSLWLYYT